LHFITRLPLKHQIRFIQIYKYSPTTLLS